VHAVIILTGRGACLIGNDVRAVAPYDLCRVPALTWHQFRAAEDAPLGFLCLVRSDRDRPQLPTDSDLATLRSNTEVAAFIRV
ncbi:MAG: cupin domain-containing protein, partial [Candidatus Eremiobacteraeota bacterium]|nr:cupin domain-containing protein [Candidatus Eremiobacteraeota bacterium]